MSNLQFSSKDFVHLHLHSDYSLLQSTVQLKPLVKQLEAQEMKACAITDYANLYGAISFYSQMKAHDLHPIIGYEAIITDGSRFERTSTINAGEKPYYHLVLLAKDYEGYQNLVYLASKAFTEGFHHKPRIDMDLLSEKSKGLVALSSGFNGSIWHYLKTGNLDSAKNAAGRFKDVFGEENFYLEIQNHGLDEEQKVVKNLIEFSKSLEIPVVATNDVHYLAVDDSKAHEMLFCIAEGKTVNDNSRTTFNSNQYHLRTAAEMWELFGNELPESLNNTLKIAEMCQMKLPSGDNLTLPEFPIPPEANCATIDDYFSQVVMEGFAERQETVWNSQQTIGKLKYSLDDYHSRAEKEIKTIKDMGFPGYFLIVWEFIRYAKEKQIPVGPGRGSAAGSLVAYCLGITDVDPIQYDLLFERFLNPERVSMPDIDIDFCVRGRAEVINHVTEFYGRETVCQIVTFGTMASKAAIKDIGRALNMPLGDVEKIAKLIPPPVRGRNISISQALEQVPDLKKAFDTDPKCKELIDLALRIEGCARHTSVHAAGVVISPKPLHELIPVALSSKNELTSQFTMNDLEKVGMLKMDFLALTTLTIISDCLKSINQSLNEVIDWSVIALDDEKTMALFGEGRTEAVFQFESGGMQEICRRLKPKELEDLSALNALYRPGPLDGGMVDDFIARHRGEKKVQYLVPEMKDILSNTYGILVYQEQIMQLAQKLAGYSLGEADMMRRAMGKKKREEMAVHEEKFVTGSVNRGIKQEKAEEIFKLMAQFADYGFNRSHSVAYAYLAFQTAYLKAHYPSYFYASVLSHEAQDSAKVYKYANELRTAGLKLLPPDINESGNGFTPLESAVRFGLTAIKGIGTASVDSIIETRNKGAYTSLFDFTSRLDQGAINRRSLESLITAGAFDSVNSKNEAVNVWRAKLFGAIDSALKHGQRVYTDTQRGQTGLFGAVESSSVEDFTNLPEAQPWSQAELSKQEKSSVGFYLSVHPLDEYRKTLDILNIPDIAHYQEAQPGETISIAGIVSGAQVKYSKKGNRFCIFRIEDQTSGAKCLVWSENFQKYSDLLKDDELLMIEGRVESNEGQEMTIILNEAKKLADASRNRARKIAVTIPQKIFTETKLDELFTILSKESGKCEVVLNLQLDNDIKLQVESQPLRIRGTDILERQLIEKGCQVNWIW